MPSLLSIAGQEIARTLTNPKRLLNLLKTKRRRHQWAHLKLKRRIGDEWSPDQHDDAFRSRNYESYDAYLEHQKDKLGTLVLDDYDVEFRQALRQRLEGLDFDWPNTSALCLAARIGTEVKAFLDVGAFAIGLDLNPGSENKYVVCGDFHDLQYADHSIDVIYSNSLDHALDVKKIMGEVHRVLRPTGHLIIEPIKGRDEGQEPQYYEAFSWSHIDDLAKLIEQQSFALISRNEFTIPWKGEQLIFAVRA